MIYFAKINLFKGIIPFWNNTSLSGQPLWQDPQSPLIYPLNFIYLLFPINTGFIVNFFIHSFISGIGMYLLLKELFNNKKASEIGAVLWMISPKFTGYLKAGHLGLINSWSWIPLFIFVSYKISKKTTKKLIASNAILIYFLYVNHAITSAILASFLLFLFLIFKPKKLIYYFCSVFLGLGLLSFILIPQLIWSQETTRFLLFNNPQIYPIWTSKLEIVTNSFWIYSKNYFQIEPEKWLFLGLFSSLIAFMGFLQLKRKTKLYLVFVLVSIILFSLNNANPFYEILLKFKPYILLRVTTRVWFIFNLVIVVLFTKFLSNIKNKNLFIFISLFSIIELLFVNQNYLNIPKKQNLVSEKISQFIKEKNKNNKFRILCTDRCVSQKDAAINQLELIDGYNTLQQKNYYEHSWQLTGAFYNYYTLSIPPFGAYKHDNLIPNINSLSEYNTKYLITKYQINNNQLTEIETIDDYHIYEINNFLNRAYLIKKENNIDIYQNLNVKYYSPNKIIVNIPDEKISNELILAEVYSKGWNATDEHNNKLLIQESGNRLRKIIINQDTNEVILKYTPPGLKIGLFISMLSLILFFYLLNNNNIVPTTKVK